MRKWVLVCFAALAAVGLIAGTLLTGASARTTRLEAGLIGEREVPGPGDADGTGGAHIRLNAESQRVCFRLSWRRITPPAAAHIHEGRRGVAGPVVVTLFASTAPLPATIHAVGGCARDVPRSLIREIRQHPRHYYVNVHNADFPAGAIRGQLHR